MGQILFKKAFPHIVAILAILAINIAYFYPQLTGKTIRSADILGHQGMAKEVDDLHKATGEDVLWTNSMFGGMPTYQIGGHKIDNYLENTRRALSLFFGGGIGIFNTLGVSFYILFVTLGLNSWLALIGSLGFMLTTNNIVLWGAGHTNKMYVLGTSAILIAGVLAAYRKNKYLLAFALFSYGLGINLYYNHVQMTYYLFLGMLILMGFLLFDTIKNKKTKQFMFGSLALIAGGVLAVGSSTGRLWTTYEFSKDTMRGEPILKSVKNTEAKTSSETAGLAYDYAMQWSDGFIDLFSIYIPRVAGGSSAERVGKESKLYKDLSGRGAQLGNDFKMPLYWGGRGSTSGPSYMGAVLFLFFLMGLQLKKGPVKWWLISAFLFTLMISLGKNFPLLNEPFFNNFPFFSKFRAPSSVIGVTSIFFIILATFGLKASLEGDKKKILKALYVSLGIAGSLSLFFALVGPSMFDFSTPGDARLQQGGYNINAILADRKGFMRSDALRSLAFVLLGASLVWAFVKEKINKNYALIGIGILTLVDLWSVGKRYLNSSDFKPRQNIAASFVPRSVDQQILNAEKSRGDYRVLDLSINTFNSSSTSYFHNTIGGYNPAKLQRFQDIIDYHISKNNQAVLNMLNTKYFITQNQQLQVNNNALGTAWFVDNIRKVGTPKDEIEALSNFNPRNEAIILDEEFDNYIGGFSPVKRGSITLTDYKPHHLTYKTNTNSEQLAVFSEVWYGPNKGWQAYIDGEKVDHIRTNYLLRAMKVPIGQHTIEFVFNPSVFKIGNNISQISSLLVLLLTIGFIGYKGYKFFKETDVEAFLAAQQQQKTKQKPSLAKTKAVKSTRNKKGKKRKR